MQINGIFAVPIVVGMGLVLMAAVGYTISFFYNIFAKKRYSFTEDIKRLSPGKITRIILILLLIIGIVFWGILLI